MIVHDPPNLKHVQLRGRPIFSPRGAHGNWRGCRAVPLRNGSVVHLRRGTVSPGGIVDGTRLVGGVLECVDPATNGIFIVWFIWSLEVQLSSHKRLQGSISLILRFYSGLGWGHFPILRTTQEETLRQGRKLFPFTPLY